MSTYNHPYRVNSQSKDRITCFTCAHVFSEKISVRMYRVTLYSVYPYSLSEGGQRIHGMSVLTVPFIEQRRLVTSTIGHVCVEDGSIFRWW